jgi:hypothetical protein
MVVQVQIVVFLDVTPCSITGVYLSFAGNRCLPLQSISVSSKCRMEGLNMKSGGINI